MTIRNLRDASVHPACGIDHTLSLWPSGKPRQFSFPSLLPFFHFPLCPTLLFLPVSFFPLEMLLSEFFHNLSSSFRLSFVIFFHFPFFFQSFLLVISRSLFSWVLFLPYIYFFNCFSVYFHLSFRYFLMNRVSVKRVILDFEVRIITLKVGH